MLTATCAVAQGILEVVAESFSDFDPVCMATALHRCAAVIEHYEPGPHLPLRLHAEDTKKMFFGSNSMLANGKNDLLHV